MSIKQALGLPFIIWSVLVVGGCSPQDTSDADQVRDTQGAQDREGEFCNEHRIAEAECPFCNPSLVESMGMCSGHGVPEAYCYQCNRSLVEAFKSVGDWCAPHDRPESQCYICNPQLDPALSKAAGAETEVGRAPAATPSPAAQHALGRQSRVHQPPVAECPKANTVVRFKSPTIAREAGLEYATVEIQSISKRVECNAVIDYNRNMYAHLSTQVPGIVAEVHVDLGDEVKAGEVLATITSAHLGVAKSHYLQAVAVIRLWEKNHARESSLHASGISTEKALLEAETHLAESRIELAEAEQILMSFGLTPEEIKTIAETEDTSTHYVVTASFDAVIVGRHAVIGEVVDTSEALLVIADLTQMWAILDVYEVDLAEVGTGQSVVLLVESLPGEVFGGYISWVSSQLNPQTRTLQTRAELDNSRGLLRANTFAQAEILVRDREPVLLVPQDAVQWEGCCNVVFVKHGDMLYQPRPVHLGDRIGSDIEVLAGLNPGEEVVTQGSFLLKTEILKGNIGAGCCEEHPGN